MKNFLIASLACFTFFHSSILAQPWYPVGTGTNNAVYAISAQGAGFFIGGKFTSALGGESVNLAHIEQNGGAFELDTLYNLPLNVSYTDTTSVIVPGTFVEAILPATDRVNIGGYFINPETGQSASGGYIEDTAFHDVFIPSVMPIRALAAFQGKVIYAGDMSLFAVNSSTFDFIADFEGDIHSLQVFNGELYAAGDFTEMDGKYARNIAGWNGTEWRGVGGGINGEIYSMCIYDGQLVAGGHFSVAGTAVVNNVAAWDGNAWNTLGVGVSGNFNTKVTALVEYENTLYVGGNFDESFGVSMDNLARWNGTQWYPVGDGTNGQVHALAVYDSLLLIGGDFSEANGMPHNNIVAYAHEPINGIEDASQSSVVRLSYLTNNRLKIQLGQEAGLQQAQLALIDMNGRQIKNTLAPTESVLSLQDVAPGVYILQVSAPDGFLHSSKVIRY